MGSADSFGAHLFGPAHPACAPFVHDFVWSGFAEGRVDGGGGVRMGEVGASGDVLAARFCSWDSI